MASIVTETSCQHGKREVDFVTARRDGEPFVRLWRCRHVNSGPLYS